MKRPTTPPGEKRARQRGAGRTPVAQAREQRLCKPTEAVRVRQGKKASVKYEGKPKHRDKREALKGA